MAGAASHQRTSIERRGASEFEVKLSDEEWRQRLTPEQYRVLREHGTERAGTSPLDKNYDPGVYHCAGCGQPLFDAATKFNSRTGWPSFYAPLENAVETQTDRSFFMSRTEVHCRRCGGHLGHVFEDGPQPTGLRYCMNGVSLDFHAGETAPPPSAARPSRNRSGRVEIRRSDTRVRGAGVETERTAASWADRKRLGSVLERNIRALDQRREQEEAKAGFQDRLARAITRATGSMAFVYLHLLLFGGWILVNLGFIPGLAPFDPSFTVLAMAASVEAIFLSTFVLITQNRMAAAAEKRAELDLQISLLAEHEITKLDRNGRGDRRTDRHRRRCRSRSRGDHAGRDPRGGARRDRGAARRRQPIRTRSRLR